MNYDPSACDLCGSPEINVVMDLSGPSMTSDSRILPLPIRKVECTACGLVRRGDPFSEGEMALHYDDEYELGQSAAASEPLFYTGRETVPRSAMAFRWIDASLGTAGMASPRSVLEIGCGEGSLLGRMADAWPESTCEGLDLAQSSVGLAASRGLRVKRGGYQQAEGLHDLIVGFTVLEHVPSPVDFLRRLGAHLTPGGHLVTVQPCQDHGSYDVFFSDHLHHFHSHHVELAARHAGLVEVHRDVSHPHFLDCSLHVLGRAGAYPEAELRGPVPDRQPISDVIAHWRHTFACIDAWLEASRGRPLGLWGLGQMSVFWRTYTQLGNRPIAVGFDDNPQRFQGHEAFPVRTFEEGLRDFPSDAAILVTFVPGPAVRARLEASRRDYFAPLTPELITP